MKQIFTFLGILCSVVVTAQEFTGQAFYESKTNIDMDLSGRDMTDQMRKQIEENMKKMLEKTFVLTFNKDESMYKEEQKLDAPGAGGGGMFRSMAGNFTAGTQYKNTKDNVYLQEQEFFGKQFLISDSLSGLDWQLENESKQIGQYVVFKATAVKQLDNSDWQSMRRRNQDREKEEAQASADSTKSVFDEIEIPKEITITAWYTPQIPVSQGPGEYWGLPGLILEVQADRTSILCSRIVMNPKEAEAIRKPTRGTKVTQEEYKKIVREKMEEMQDMYGGQGRGGRGSSVQIRMN